MDAASAVRTALLNGSIDATTMGQIASTNDTNAKQVLADAIKDGSITAPEIRINRR